MEPIREVPAFKVSGFVALGVVLALAIASIWQLWSGIHELTAVLGRDLRINDATSSTSKRNY
ncbi:hypothetical protein [Gloeocapsopsis sp. IPPAS B-1203]|uniref:hypothetical protein n=1 Tax=Gloeocapsopsis sp. IPPAS B-1203 TaxID=2049454 RepID=UPI001180448D|nr:hypothetical protein [Gloeocapsopsis sp. IPPAS B-1203]